MLEDDFKLFTEQISISVKKLDIDGTQSGENDNTDNKMLNRYRRIVKKLNKEYWNEENEENNGYIAGSLGRHTAIKGISDMDMLFVLPPHVKEDFNSRSGNGQSQLLQEVKSYIKEIYPKTIVRGDGQVVVVTMKGAKCEIEVCPVFERSDGSFDYPDSNKCGRWRTTNPLPEIATSEIEIDETNGHFQNVCRMIRAWKNNKGFKFNGLLIDTLIYNFFEDNRYKHHKEGDFNNYLQLFIDLFDYLKNQNKDQSYWFALGSRQHVYDKKGSFISRAKKAHAKIKDCTVDSEELYDYLKDIFGSEFPSPVAIQEATIEKASFGKNARNTEEHIRNMFPIDIRYDLKIDCDVEVDGFRNGSLRHMLQQNFRLRPQKKLTFKIVSNEFEENYNKLSLEDKKNYNSYQIYWKVLNRGQEAINRDEIRGQIVSGGKNQVENTKFQGEHLVECYIVHDNIVVAKDKIKVPIDL